MTTKRIIILVLILAMITVAVFGFFYLKTPTTPTTGTSSGTNFFSNIFSFGKSNTTNPTTNSGTENNSNFIPSGQENSPVTLKKVSGMPVAGFGLFNKEVLKQTTPETTPAIETTTTNKTTTSKIIKINTPATEFKGAVRYVDKATGNIYQTFTDNLEEHKFSTMVIPQIYEASFTNNGGSVVMRYLKEDDTTIETLIGNFSKEVLGIDSLSDKMNVSFLPENITDLSITPDSLNIFYLFNSNDSAIGISAGPQGDIKKQVFSSSFTEWLSQYVNTKMITLTTKPSALVPGFMYSIDPAKKGMNKILGNINGLTTLTSPDGKLVLYSNNNLALNIYNIDTNKVTSVGVRTLSEKCVWNKSSDKIYCAVPKFVNQGSYPDSWYQGEVSFADNIWQVDPINGNTIMLADLSSMRMGEDIDAIKLAVEDTGNNLFFVNKKNSYLWELNLK